MRIYESDRHMISKQMFCMVRYFIQHQKKNSSKSSLVGNVTGGNSMEQFHITYTQRKFRYINLYIVQATLFIVFINKSCVVCATQNYLMELSSIMLPVVEIFKICFVSQNFVLQNPIPCSVFIYKLYICPTHNFF